jgi:hypothetical protein
VQPTHTTGHPTVPTAKKPSKGKFPPQNDVLGGVKGDPSPVENSAPTKGPLEGLA